MNNTTLNAYETINMETYTRRDLLEFYKTFDRPCFNILCKENAKKIYRYAKLHKKSFFLLSCYAIAKAVNDTPQLRERMLNGKAVRYTQVDICTPIAISDNEFVEVILPYFNNFAAFEESAKKIMSQAKADGKASCQENTEDRVLISCVPWLHFEALTLTELDTKQVMPIVTYGKMEKGLIPINLKASHYFVDGMHVAKFFENVRYNFANPKSLWFRINWKWLGAFGLLFHARKKSLTALYIF